MHKNTEPSAQKPNHLLPLPHSGGLLNAETFFQIRVQDLKAIAQKVAPNTVFPHLQDLSDKDTIKALEVLATRYQPDEELYEVLDEVFHMMTNAGLARLKLRGFNVDSVSPSEAATGAYLNHNESFKNAFTDLLGSEDIGQSFTIFQSQRFNSGTPMRELNQDILKQVSSMCEDHFKLRGYCPNFTVRPVRNPDKSKIGLQIVRGGKNQGKAVYENNKFKAWWGRLGKTDVVIFDLKTKSFLISSLSTDVQFYAEVLSFALFGDPKFFSTKVNPDLSFAKSSSLMENLIAKAGEDIERIFVKDRIIDMPGEGPIIHKGKGRNGCVLEQYKPLTEREQRIGQVTHLRIRFDFKVKNKCRRSVTLSITGSSLKFGGVNADDFCQKVLLSHGVYSANEN